jgi:hypothetical protein
VPGRTVIGFAQLEQADVVPFLRERGREAYRDFITRPMPRAFAIAPNGAFGVAFQITNRSQFDVVQGALQRCNSRANGACRLYALDNRVVWTEP